MRTVYSIRLNIEHPLECYPAFSSRRYRVNVPHRLDNQNQLDEASFIALYEAHYAELLRYATRFLGNETKAQDAVQEAFLRLWRRKDDLDASNQTRALLYKAVRNLSLNAIRNEQRRHALLEEMDHPESPPNPDAETSSELLRGLVETWISELPDRRREAFELSRFEGFRYSEIASVMGITIKTVENHIVLALQYLRKKMDTYDPNLLQKS